MGKKYEIIDKIIAAEIYLYIIFMFVTKGEAIRNILIFSSFILWLTTLKYRKNKQILVEPVSILFWLFMITILLSVMFSIEPLYSFKSLRGDPLKSVLLFSLVSTVLSEEKRLKRFFYVSYLILLFTISVGYYSYWVHDLPLMKPHTLLRYVWSNRFAVDLNTLLPFSFFLLLISNNFKFRIIIIITLITGIFALILSTSRGGIAAFLCAILILSIYMSKKRGYNLKLILPSITLVFILLGTISYYSSPYVKKRVLSTTQEFTTFNERTEIWKPLVYAAAERPVFGWGYGGNIFKIDVPFENTPFKVAPLRHRSDFRDPHNPFLRILFHQGIVGLISYLVLLIFVTTVYWKNAFITESFKSYILIACASILIGTYFVNAVVENSRLLDLTLIIGIGLAAKNSRSEDSHS
jgi:O-antigen ligase